ncbi:hypothetical protein J1614_003349 [Plenodomus biglobosus]|nr:hypothetical protein J1614_003349 [Plenodomus biglobosus]
MVGLFCVCEMARGESRSNRELKDVTRGKYSLETETRNEHYTLMLQNTHTLHHHYNLLVSKCQDLVPTTLSYTIPPIPTPQLPQSPHPPTPSIPQSQHLNPPNPYQKPLYTDLQSATTISLPQPSIIDTCLT